MANAGTLIVSLMLDSTRYAAGLSQTSKKTNQTVKQIQREIKGLVNFAVGAGGLYAVVRGFQAVTRAAAAQEEATLRLSQTLKNNNQFTHGNLKALEDQASALQKVTRFSDEQITSAQSLLMSMGKLDAQGVRKITPSMLDFATAMGMDLDSAAKLLGKTLGSSTNALGRYGIQVDMTKDSTGRLAEVVAQLQAQFADQSKVRGAATAMAQLKNAYGEVMEEIGFVLNGPQVGVAQGWTLVFNAIADGMKKVREEGDLIEKHGTRNNMAGIFGGPAGAIMSRRGALSAAKEKEQAEDIWREQQNFLKQAAAGGAGGGPAQNWGKTPFARFGMNVNTMAPMRGGQAWSNQMKPPRLAGFTESDINSSDWWQEQVAERERIQIELTETTRRESEERAEIAQREADNMIMAAERFGNQWGSILYSATNQAGNAFDNIRRMFSEMAEQIAMQAAMMMVFNIATGNPLGAMSGVGGMIKGMLGFAGGGYTGSGSPNAIAGYVHKGEYVVPSNVVGRYGAGSFDNLLAALDRGGGYTDQSVNNFSLSGFSGDMTLEQFAAKLNQARRHRLIA